MNTEDSEHLAQSLCFDAFVLDAELKELRGPAGRVDVQRKVLHVLFYLAHNADRVVSKDELLAGVWPGTVVGDAVLSQAIRKARSALGDDGDAQQLIRTVHGHGYRLQARVEPLSPQAATASPEAGGARLAPAFDPLERTYVPGLDAADTEPEFAPLAAMREGAEATQGPAGAPSGGAEAPSFEALPNSPERTRSVKQGRLLLALVAVIAVGAAAFLLLA